jgi:hypothetical protein
MRMSDWLTSIGLALAVLVFIAYPAEGQLTEATLRGVVTDGAGSVIPASPVSAKNENTGEVRSTVTDDSGLFLLPELPPGSYTVSVRVAGFKSYEQHGLKLNVGQATEINIKLEAGGLNESVNVTAGESEIPISTEGRLSDTFDKQEIVDRPLSKRDVFLLPSLSPGATLIAGAATATKLASSPVVTVNGTRYRGNDYVLDGSMDTNPNNTGEPAIVPSLESIEEFQVQTGNFSSEFGRGNGSVVNIRTKSGTNSFHGSAWAIDRNDAFDARNFFSTTKPPLRYNQFGFNFGGPIFKDKTFFFVNYEGTRVATATPLTFQVETPQFRNYVFANDPNSIAAKLLREFPAPTPIPGTEETITITGKNPSVPGVAIPAIGRAVASLPDYNGADQYLGRIDHSFDNDKDKLTGRWIAEYQRDDGGLTAFQGAAVGKVVRGAKSGLDGYFGNANIGYIHVFDKLVNDARISMQQIDVTTGNGKAVVPEIDITGITLPFGDVFQSETRLRTYEARDTAILDRGKHSIKFGIELRKIFKGISIGPPNAGTYAFNNLSDFANDKPYEQSVTVNPATGQLTGFPRYFYVFESGAFVQDDWRVTSRLNLSLGVRHDYFGDPHERDGILSSIVFGPGDNFDQRLASASIERVNHLYKPQMTNFSPRLGLAYDPFGDGKTSIRAGFSIAYQPHHGQSIGGARALPPDAIQGIIEPSVGIGTQIDYGIPVPFNPEFATGLNSHGGVISKPGEPPIRITGFVVNPTIKTQYSENMFLNVQRQVGKAWVVELGYVGTNGVNLERIDDINRFDGDLLVNHGVLKRINPYFGPVLFVTNGVSSSYNALIAQVQHKFSDTFSINANYRWSKWIDTSSDTSTGQFANNDEPGKGAEDAACLKCERGLSMFNVPRQLTFSLLWTPRLLKGEGLPARMARDWQLSAIGTAQAGRPFSIWNGASSEAGGDYNLDGGGGAVGGGFYDRPNAPPPGSVKSSFSNSDFLNGLFNPGIFPIPTPGTDGNLGRNTFQGPGYVTLDLSVSRTFVVKEMKRLQFRIDAFNALNNVNLYLPNTDLSLALVKDPNGGFSYSTNSIFGKSTQAFDARTLQGTLKFTF